MKYGYCRTTTYWQQLEEQKQALQNEMCNEVYVEEITGTAQRPVRDELLSKLKKGDTLVVTSLDRLLRDPHEGVILTNHLFKKGVKLHILNIGLLEGKEIINIFTNTMNAMLDMRHIYQSERVREAKAIAKQREGYTEGRPKMYTPEQLEHAMKLLETKTYNEVAAETKISRSTLIREKSKRKNLHNN